jgi:uncharacterized SAM-binding protein YcdF (DUF218 family)
MFMFKKIVAPFFFPLSICLEILWFGLFLLWFTRKQKTGRVTVSIGVIVLTIFSYSAPSDMLLRPLEYKYPPITDISAFSDTRWVVVLSGGHSPDPKLPVTSQLSDASLSRVVEGIRLHKKLSNSKLLLSGGSAFSAIPEAKTMAKIAVDLGIDKEDLLLETESKDTKDQARFIQNIISDDRFVLVTSASHISRSMALFQKNGMQPMPAPIGHQVKERQNITPAIFFPSSHGIEKMERVFYEYLGLAWAKIQKQI